MSYQNEPEKAPVGKTLYELIEIFREIDLDKK